MSTQHQKVGRRIFKKASKTGKYTVYLGKRDFYERDGVVDPIEGMVKLQDPADMALPVFAAVRVTLDFGVDAGELLGSAMTRTLYSDVMQVHPPKELTRELSSLQRKLQRKLADSAFPFHFELPAGAPASVSLENVSEDVQQKSCSVEWELVVFSAATPDAKESQWSDYVRLNIRKLNYAPSPPDVTHKPHQEAVKKFALSSGEVKVVAELDNEVYTHGAPITVNLGINNAAKRSVKGIEMRVRQFASVRTPKGEALCHKAIISELASSEGCPIGPGSNLERQYVLVPTKESVGAKQNVALDGHGRDNSDTCLASSTQLLHATEEPQVGIIISYDVKIKVFFSGINAMASCKLPFMLSTAAPDVTKLSVNLDKDKKPQSAEVDVADQQPAMTPEEVDNGEGLELVFEEFLAIRAEKFFGQDSDNLPAAS